MHEKRQQKQGQKHTILQKSLKHNPRGGKGIVPRMRPLNSQQPLEKNGQYGKILFYHYLK